MKKFDLSQIKAGYLLVVENIETHKTRNMTVSYGFDRVPHSSTSLVCCCPNEEWWPLSRFNSDTLEYKGDKIVAIYGCTTPRCLLDNSTEDRELLWERKEPKKMTVAEVCEALGHDVEIVEEG